MFPGGLSQAFVTLTRPRAANRKTKIRLICQYQAAIPPVLPHEIATGVSDRGVATLRRDSNVVAATTYTSVFKTWKPSVAAHEGTIFCLSKPCQVSPRFDSVSCGYQGRG
jgi:hypothetical protein